MEMKSWFGSLDLAYKYAIVFGSLLLTVLILGLIKVIYDRRKLRQHIRLADEEGRSSKGSHRELNMREKDAGDLFGIRAIEAGYFGGVAQSAPNSPLVTPRGSLSMSGSPYSRPAWPASVSVLLDLNKYERSLYGENMDSASTGQHRTPLKMPSSPTISTDPFNAPTKSPSPTKSPPTSPLKSPLTVPALAHFSKTVLRPSTAERTGRHSHSPPLDMSKQVPPSPLNQTGSVATPPSPSLGRTEHAAAYQYLYPDTSDHHQPYLPEHYKDDAPQLPFPDFFGTSPFVLSDFERPKSRRASIMSKFTTSTKKKSLRRPPLPKAIPAEANEIPALPANAVVDSFKSRPNGLVQEKSQKVPPLNEENPIRPLSVQSFESIGLGKEYYDYPPVPHLVLTLPARSPLRLSTTSSKRKSKTNASKHSQGSNDISPRTSFSFEKTLSEYQREATTPRRYRIGDTPLSSLSPKAMSSPLSSSLTNDFYGPPPPKSPRRQMGRAY